MLIPLGSVHRARVSGSRVKEVQCDRCRAIYFYILRRIGHGSGSAPLFLGRGAAADNAEEGAHKNLKKRLDKECDPVACPNCGHYQKAMIGAARSARLSWGKIWFITCLAFFLPVFLMMAFPQDFQDRFGGLFVLIAPITLTVLIIMRMRINPNENPVSRIGLKKPGPQRFIKREDAEQELHAAMYRGR